ncbi:hypothetical protein MJO28_009339 [Puccinia striiformis f. sp. tritici]|uniref:Uncharacterized protein n=1 Tax=Puccinia striiformis f. sp. tritici TaxID=168172 RepID=A0ACC0E6U1_9BASI|nr:hypothetical protein MJO28_009339 [Puccinia striiformis f. sp. tritici]
MAADVDGATEYDMAYQLCAFVKKDVFVIIETLDGFDTYDWPKLKTAMISYWGRTDVARFTLRDLDSLVESWTAKGGVLSLVDYQAFRQKWDPIQSYLIRNDHIDTVEEVRIRYYQAFAPGIQDEIRKVMIKNKTMITTKDRRFKLPPFEKLKEAIEEVMKDQTALTFELSREAGPSSSFQESNEVMKRMGEERRPKEVAAPPKAETNIDELTKMFQAFEQRMEDRFTKELAARDSQNQASASRSPIVCYYCHCEYHGTTRCRELEQDKRDGLVEQRGNNFFLPNGAMIPFDPSRPIRHVVASYQPGKSSASCATTEYKAGCGTLEPWYPPAVASQSFAGAYELDPAGRKRHEEAKPYKAPLAPPAASRRPLRRNQPPVNEPAPTQPPMSVNAPFNVPADEPTPVAEPMSEDEEEPEVFERVPEGQDTEDTGAKEAPKPKSILKRPPKAAGTQPKACFEREATKEHPHAVDNVLKRISDLNVPDLTVSELMAISPSVAEGMKKWVSRKRVEIGPEELKVQSGTLLEGSECYDSKLGARLYSCPLGYLPCLVGDEENEAAPLIDSGSQLNIISDSLANKLNITPRVNFSSAVYGINNQACELIGVAEDVSIKVGKNISGTCHFWITRLDGPLILGRPLLIDFEATLLYSAQGGERIVLPDSMGRNIEVSLCTQDSGRWERQFPAQGRKGVLTHMGRIQEEPECAKHFL